MTPVEAVSAPRVHCDRGLVHVEGRVPSSVVDGLRQLGYRVRHSVLSYDIFFALVGMLALGPGGRLRGAVDPRGDGAIALEA